MARLKYTEIKPFREALLRRQNFLCPLCGREIEQAEGTLDHCHKTGQVRAVLHRNCNGVLGRIEHRVGTIKMTDRIVFLENVIKFLQEEPLSVIHPTHGKKKKRKKKS